MSTEANVPESVQPKLALVVSLNKPVPQPISQRDLVEYCYFKKLAREAQEQFEAKEADLRARLEAGAQIEPGMHIAKLKVSLFVE